MDADRVYVPLQNATTAVDGQNVVVPLSASIAALDRETGVVQWTSDVESTVPPVVGGHLLFVASAAGIHAYTAATGVLQWTIPIDRRVRAPMLLRGTLLVALTEPDELIALRIDTREIVWRTVVGESGPVLMNADDRAVYLTSGGRVMSVLLADGAIAWRRELVANASLSEPSVGEDRVFVGSTTDSFWALDPESGRDEWTWSRRIFGGDVIGAAVEDEVVYVASLDSIIRALNEGNGAQRWKKDAGRPVFPPRAFFGVVVTTGLSPTVSTFNAKTGAAVSTWTAPPGAELQGPPLIDEHLKPFRVAMVVIMRDGRVIAVRPTAMMFEEPPAGKPLATLPGRPVTREQLPSEPPLPTRAGEASESGRASGAGRAGEAGRAGR